MVENNFRKSKPYLRLNRITILVAVTFSLVHFCVVVPGDWRAAHSFLLPPQHATLDVWEHGWPCVHMIRVGNRVKDAKALLRRENLHEDSLARILHGDSQSTVKFANRIWLDARYINSDQYERIDGHWSNLQSWNYFDRSGFCVWNPYAVVINVGVFLLMLFVVVVLLEWLQKPKSRWYQITLKEIFVYGVLASLVSSWLYNEYTSAIEATESHKRLHEICRVRPPRTNNFVFDSLGSNWMDRAFDGSVDPISKQEDSNYYPHRFPMFFRLQNLELSPREPTQTEAIIQELKHRSYSNLKSLSVAFYDFDHIRIVESLDPGQLETLKLSNITRDHPQLDFVNRFERLKHLRLYNFDLGRSEPPDIIQMEELEISQCKNVDRLAPQLRQMKRLKTIRLDWIGFAAIHDCIPESVTEIDLVQNEMVDTKDLNRLARLPSLEVIRFSIQYGAKQLDDTDLATWPAFPKLKQFSCLLPVSTKQSTLDLLFEWIEEQPKLDFVFFWQDRAVAFGVMQKKPQRWVEFSDRLREIEVFETW